MQLELISFKLCPFVQRAVITLNSKDVDYKVTYIDLADPPEWFSELSPLGKVPVLKVDDEVLFESAVINEFLDDITGADLQPDNPLQRAKNRAWTEFASAALGNSYMMKTAPDAERYQKYFDRLSGQLQYLEKQLGDGPWFNGEQFSLTDTAYAPLFVQLSVSPNYPHLIDTQRTPKLHAWAERLKALPAVKNSVVPEFNELYIEALKKADSYTWHQWHSAAA